MNRISNFNLLRATLHVKFVVTGSSFHYGKLLVSYNPCFVFDQFEAIHHGEQRFQNLVSYSQRPSLLIDAAGSTGGTMILPYFHPANNLSIPAAEWQTMGNINVNTFVQLKHANGSNETVEVSIVIWATDVHLSGPTSTNPLGLTPQGGGGEYAGMVSGPAAIVEYMAGSLAKAPVIGKWAMATQTIASKVGSVARYFGFSRPVVAEQAPVTINRRYPNIVNTNVHDTCLKLSLDIKQEITVDTRVLGLAGSDELTIASIVQRPSFVDSFTWPVSAVSETLLWTTYVNPAMWKRGNYPIVDPVNNGFFPTALCFGALPFHYWRGTIKFRFMIVGSAYHKGRLMIRHDPRVFVSDELNTNSTLIVDIEETKDFSIDVGWTHSLPFLEFPDVNTTPNQNGTTRLPGNNWSNGILEIAVLNSITSPNSVVNNDMSVLVYVSAGEDFEVLGPDETNLRNLTYVPQGASDIMADPNENDPLAAAKSFTFGNPGLHPELTAIHDGDPIVSFRQCLKRYSLFNAWTVAGIANGVMRLITSDFPLYRGRVVDAVDVALLGSPAVLTPYNHCNTTLLNYLTPAFVARTGGLRRMYVFPKSNTSHTAFPATVQRALRQIGQSLTWTNTPGNNNAPNTALQYKLTLLSNYPIGWSASAMTDADGNPALAVELPYHNNRRWAPARRINFSNPSVGLTSHIVTAPLEMKTDSRMPILDYVSIAEDFNLSFFLNAPVFFLNARPPVPA